MEPGTLVLVHLLSPKEKYWGLLKALGPAGITLRGLELALFDDWARQFRSADDPELGVATLFFPLHRVEKVFEDSRIGSVASYEERFLQIAGREVRKVLSADPRSPDADSSPN